MRNIASVAEERVSGMSIWFKYCFIDYLRKEFSMSTGSSIASSIMCVIDYLRKELTMSTGSSIVSASTRWLELLVQISFWPNITYLLSRRKGGFSILWLGVLASPLPIGRCFLKDYQSVTWAGLLHTVSGPIFLDFS